MLCGLCFVAARIAYLLFFTFTRLALRLAALALTLVGALVAPSTGPGSRLVALGEDHISSQKPFVATSGDAAGSDLALLEGCDSSSQFRVSDQRPPGRQRHH